MIAHASPRDPTAVVWRRILAFGIDFAIVWAAMLAILWTGWQDNVVRRPASEVRCAVADGSRPSGVEVPDSRVYDQACIEWNDEILYLTDEDAADVSREMWLVGLGVVGLDLVLLQGLTGATVGKLITGLRVVRPDGSKANIGWDALRTLLLFVDMFCCFLPGAVLVFSTKGHRRIGDMAASTFVVDRRDVGQPILVAGLTAPPVGYPAPGYPSAGPPAPSPGGTTHDGPIWDEARDTYIQFDRSAGAWVQWDVAGERWVPIDGEA